MPQADTGAFDAVDRNLHQLLNGVASLLRLTTCDHRLAVQHEQLEVIQTRVEREDKILRMRFALKSKIARVANEELELGYNIGNGTETELGQAIRQQIRICKDACSTLEEYFELFDLRPISRSFRNLRFEFNEIDRHCLSVLNFNLSQLATESDSTPPNSGADFLRLALKSNPLYFILDESLCAYRDPLRVGYDAVRGGVRVLQLRMKSISTREHVEVARKLGQLCSSNNCLLIINDRLDIALLSHADGIHIGPTDIQVSDVRKVAPHLIVGVTSRTTRSARVAESQGADYVGCGSVFASGTKPGLPLIGLRGLRSIASNVEIPVVATGGITLNTCQSVMATGAAGFCAINSFNSRRTVKNLVNAFRKQTQPEVRRGGVA